MSFCFTKGKGDLIPLDWLSTVGTATLVGISSNLDNTSVGIVYGLKNIRIPYWFNLIVNFIGFCSALLGAYAGSIISHFISAREAGILSFCVLFGIGIVVIYTDYCLRVTDNSRNNKIMKPGIRQAIVLGFGLSFTNIATGFGATITNNYMIWPILISITVWGYLAIWLGNIVGNGIISKFLGKYSSITAGLLLIAIAFKQIL
jgi:putative Mn2+ efflux pump MntP